MVKRISTTSFSMLAVVLILSILMLNMRWFTPQKSAYAPTQTVKPSENVKTLQATVSSVTSPTLDATMERATLDAVVNGVFTVTAVKAATQTAAAIFQSTVNAEVYKLLTATAQNLPILTLTPSFAGTRGGTEVQDMERATLNAVVNGVFTATAVKAGAQTAAAVFQNTVNAEVYKLLTATAQNLPTLTPSLSISETPSLAETQNAAVANRVNTLQSLFAQTVTVGTVNAQANSILTSTAQAFPTPNPVEKNETVTALVGIRATQTSDVQQAKTGTAAIDSTIQAELKVIASATTAAKLVELRASLKPMTVDNVANTSVVPLVILDAPGVTAITFSPDGAILAAASTDRTTRLWSVTTGQLIATYVGLSARLDVGFSGDGTRIAVMSADNTLRVLNTLTGEEILTIRDAHPRGGVAVAFSPDGTRLASVGTNRSVFVWDAVKGTKLFELKGHIDVLTGVVFSPDSRLLATSSLDGTVRVWEVMTGSPILSFRSLYGPVNSLAFSLNGKLVAVAGPNTIQLIDPVAGTDTLTMRRTSGDVTDVAFSPSGKLLLSASIDRYIRIWDTTTGEYLMELRTEGQKVNDITFSADEARFASSSADGTITIWGIR